MNILWLWLFIIICSKFYLYAKHNPTSLIAYSLIVCTHKAGTINVICIVSIVNYITQILNITVTLQPLAPVYNSAHVPPIKPTNINLQIKHGNYYKKCSSCLDFHYHFGYHIRCRKRMQSVSRKVGFGWILPAFRLTQMLVSPKGIRLRQERSTRSSVSQV